MTLPGMRPVPIRERPLSQDKRLEIAPGRNDGEAML
jgi:hypothetical protein